MLKLLGKFSHMTQNEEIWVAIGTVTFFSLQRTFPESSAGNVGGKINGVDRLTASGSKFDLSHTHCCAFFNFYTKDALDTLSVSLLRIPDTWIAS